MVDRWQDNYWTMYQEGSPRGRAFLAALVALCQTHQVQVSVTGYDALVLRDLRPDDVPIYCNGIDEDFVIDDGLTGR